MTDKVAAAIRDREKERAKAAKASTAAPKTPQTAAPGGTATGTLPS